MLYYTTLIKANKYNINAIDLMIANEVDSQIGETLMDVLDTEEEKMNKFEKICNLVWAVYLKTELYSVEQIVSTIIEILYDKKNTIDTITREMIIDKL